MSVRLEKVQLDMQGRVASQDGASLQVPLEGPPLIETGFCLTVPSGRLGLKRPWTTREPGQAEITWQVESTDVVGGASCLKIVGEPEIAISSDVEVGWRLREDAWGQGYAAEAARACLEWAWANLDVSRVVAITTPANAPSWRLMERLGMVRRPDLDFAHPRFPAGHPLSRHITYVIERP